MNDHGASAINPFTTVTNTEALQPSATSMLITSTVVYCLGALEPTLSVKTNKVLHSGKLLSRKC